MAINATDISVAANGDIRWTGGATPNYTVLELHRWLQALADDESSAGDDFVDISRLTPSERSTDNIITLLGTYNIDDTVAQHLYAGSVSQNGGNDLYSGLRVLGAVNNTLTQLEIVQNNTIFTEFWGDQSTGGYNGDAVSGILMRVMIKSRSGGTDIDGKRIRVQARHWGDTYDFFNVTLGQGEAVAAIGTTPDAQNTTAQSGVTAYSHVTNTEGYQTIDLNNGNGAQPYYSKWTFGADTAGDGLKSIWEYTKDLTGNGTAKTIHGINGELFLGVTHSYTYNTETGNSFIEDDVITWGAGATAGTGLLLALNDAGTTGDVYFQLLTGVAPTNGLTINNEAADGTHDTVAVTSRTVPKIFGGSFTGTWIGAFGFGIDSGDLTAADTIQDLAGVTQTPPNNVVFTVSGLVSAEDRVLVAPRSAGILQLDQMASTTVVSGASTIVMQSAIPIDTPASGTIRVLGDGGVYDRIPYDSYAGSTFTLTTFAPDDVTNGANAFVSYIDKDAAAAAESFTTIFNASRDLFVRVRDGKASPIKTFESQAVLSNTGGSTVASRITDE